MYTTIPEYNWARISSVLYTFKSFKITNQPTGSLRKRIFPTSYVSKYHKPPLSKSTKKPTDARNFGESGLLAVEPNLGKTLRERSSVFAHQHHPNQLQNHCMKHSSTFSHSQFIIHHSKIWHKKTAINNSLFLGFFDDTLNPLLETLSTYV